MKKRACAALFIAVLLFCLPLSSSLAKAGSTNSIIKLGASGIQTNDKVYLGTYLSGPIAWLVIGSSAFSDTSVASGTSVLALLSLDLQTKTAFISADSEYYPNSALQKKMDSIYDDFSPSEQGAIASTTLSSLSSLGDISDISNQKLFALSEDEALSLSSSIIVASLPEQDPIWWWLRTSRTETEESAVNSLGNVTRESKAMVFGVRPAFHLDQSAVLFSSAATNGKVSAGIGPSALATVSQTSTSTTWKLTLLDDSRDGFAIKSTALTDTSASIDYSGATTGDREYLSAVIIDKGSIVYYGRILQLDGTTHGASGSATINIPSGITLDSDTTLKVFNEQYHNDASGIPVYTDYSSEFKNVTKPAEIPQTGDSMLPVLWLSVALLAIFGIVFSTLLSRKIKRVS